MDNPKWKNLANLPSSNEEWASYYPLLFWVKGGKQKVLYHLKNARLGLPVLISSPESKGKFASPLMSDKENIHPKQLLHSKRYYQMILVYLIFGTPFLLWFTDFFFTSVYSFILLSIGVYEKFSFKLFSKEDGYYLEERWQFYSWNCTKSAYYCYPFIMFMVVIGTAQLIVIEGLGSNQAYLLAYGLDYKKVTNNDEWWRVVTAIFLHLDLAHWASNTLMGAVFFAMYGPSLGRRILPLTFLLASLSFLAVYVSQLIFPFQSEGIIGFSGGIAGLLGYFLSANLRMTAAYPKYYWVTTLYLANLTFLSVSLVLGPGSIIAHISGFLIGLGFGYIAVPLDVSFFEEEDGSRNVALNG